MAKDFYQQNYKVFKARPRLAQYPEFDKDQVESDASTMPYADDLEALARYIVFMYDKDSPLSNENDFVLAKKQAIKKADVPSSLHEGILSASNLLVTAMIIRLKRLENNHKFTHYVSLRELFYNICMDLMAPVLIDEADKATRASDIKLRSSERLPGLREEIERLEKELFDEDEAVSRSVATMTESEISRGGAEKFAVSSEELFG